MKKTIYTLLLLMSISIFAQETKTSTTSLDLGADFQSRYIWRGLQFGGNSASAQPHLEFTSGKLTIGAWGAYSLGSTNQFQEADLYLTLAATDRLSFTLTDYYFPVDSTPNDYFKHGGSGHHVYEFLMSVAGTEGFPIGFTAATNFAGADKNGGKQSYSTYLEVNYGTKFGQTDFSFFVGGVVSDNGGYYLTSGSGLINLGISASKEVKISDAFSLPIKTSLITNPDQGNIYLTFGFSL
ncbi:MAG: hypothetical protein COZ76_10710 [Flavobacteriales bacterium CG_4_8_14_3_um_filter_35_10]|nr:MAG: hypothetical protein COV50_02585 [Flavobacteriales bacterium CG11_big_fil_rev_8_21_14_0_20_35_7]PIX06094.1 MAG: hypothetical protein COZ76_10710 [Flavobacteriales bacterium CG_4_8_14_3_um_filter_35_10]